MPDILDKDEIEFLCNVNRLATEGVPLREIAARLGVAPGTITYRVNRTRRLKIAGYYRIEDARTGESLEQLLERGEIIAAEREPATTAA